MLVKNIKKISIVFLLLVGACSLSVAGSFSQTSTGWITNKDHPPVTVQLKLSGKFDAESKQLDAILNVNLEGDWKTYWRSPGESGVAPVFKWEDDSTNIADVIWSWPAPKRYPVLGIETLGYKHEIHFPIAISVNDPTKEAVLRGTITLPSCTSICVLTDYPVDLFFTANDLTVDNDIAFEYQQALGAVPVLITAEQVKQKQNNLTINELDSYWDQINQQVVVKIKNQVNWKNADIFIDLIGEEYETTFFSKPKISVSEKTLIASFDVSSWGGDVNLSQVKIHATVIDDNLAVELVSETSNNPIIFSGSESNIFTMFLFALLGGLILNVMPCVLPVLGMKLSSVLGAHGLEKSKIRRQFLASSAGIITSFWLLAGFLLLLKFSGQALGWGIQFQNPYFIAVMVIITAIFAANMLGLFEIQLPSSAQTWLATKGDDSYIGHYLQGMFATLLATPCSAPFLGTAVGFALGASPLALLVIFTALGLGMALPWLLIAVFPSIALLLPKPGKWMGAVKGFFAILILLTSAWLLSLMVIFVGLGLVLLISLLFVIIFFVLIAKKQGKKVALIVLASTLIFSATGLLVGSLTASYWASPIKNDLQWEDLNVDFINEQVAQGKTVFVDVTADWCVTCKANKIGVIYQDPVYSALKAENIVLVKGDWTKPSKKITEYLHAYNRFGVPFNIIYGPNAPNGIELSTVLSSDAVIDALHKAQGK